MSKATALARRNRELTEELRTVTMRNRELERSLADAADRAQPDALSARDLESHRAQIAGEIRREFEARIAELEAERDALTAKLDGAVTREASDRHLAGMRRKYESQLSALQARIAELESERPVLVFEAARNGAREAAARLNGGNSGVSNR